MDGIRAGGNGAMVPNVVDTVFTDYRQYKAEMDRELAQAAESFVKIGYLLRVAEDTDILRESGYRNVAEFAAAEYGLDKTQVSRFININIRFSEGGYSGRLEEKYRKFGYAKLALMLSLPDGVNEELPGSLSKAEVQAVVDEVKAEAAVSDIEIAIEKAGVAPVQPQAQEATLLHQAAARLCREQQELYRKLWMEQGSLENMQEALAPLGEAVFMVRIPGTGRLMVVVRDQEASVTAVRTNEKERCSTEEFVKELQAICREGAPPEEAFRKESGGGLGKPAENPAGQWGKGPKQRKVSKVTKARIPKPEPAAAVGGNPAAAAKEAEESTPEGQLPGQMGIYDYPEAIPEGTETEGNGSGDGNLPGSGTKEPGEDGSAAGGPGAGNAAKHHEGVGAAEDDGRKGDIGGTRGAEEDIWMEARKAGDKLRQYFAVWGGKEQEMDAAVLQSVYRTAICLAAAIEKVMIRRGRDHG